MIPWHSSFNKPFGVKNSWSRPQLSSQVLYARLKYGSQVCVGSLQELPNEPGWVNVGTYTSISYTVYLSVLWREIYCTLGGRLGWGGWSRWRRNWDREWDLGGRLKFQREIWMEWRLRQQRDWDREVDWDGEGEWVEKEIEMGRKEGGQVYDPQENSNSAQWPCTLIKFFPPLLSQGYSRPRFPAEFKTLHLPVHLVASRRQTT